MKKVAIIDDDDIFKFTTKVKFEKLELSDEVLIFNDGEEAIEYINAADVNSLPEILLLDINMPIVDGWDFLDLFHVLPSDKQSIMVIYMLSSSINPDDVKRAEDSPYVRDYITKPIRDEDLTRIFQD